MTPMPSTLLCAAFLACAQAPLSAPPAQPANIRAAPESRADALSAADRLRLAEAFRLSDAVGEALWPGWDAAPFGILLVTPEREYLLRHESPTPDFEPLGRDPVLEVDVYARPRVFPPNLLASFPAVAGIPTIVIGQPENTGKTSTEWVLTLLHEHFHQLQYAQPEYFQRLTALDLARGDESGMWILNYPFPYDDAEVGRRFRDLGRTAVAAVETPGDDALAAVARAWRDFAASAPPDDIRYLSFQIWQEGVARYVELELALHAVEIGYAPLPGFRALPDYRPYTDVARELRAAILEHAADPQLDARRRVAVYPVGAAVAMALERAGTGWRTRYFDEMLSLERVAGFAAP